MCGLESERSKLKFDAPLNWQPVEFSKCVDRRPKTDKMTFVLQFLLLHSGPSANVIFLAGKPNKTELAQSSRLEIKAEAMAVAVD